MILFGEDSLRRAVHEFVAHYHHERNHQGLANRLISRKRVILRKRAWSSGASAWGGMLNYYYRAAA
jgi:putative transposase